MFYSLISRFNKILDQTDLAKLFLRLTFGILMLFHGFYKIQNGIDWIADMLLIQGLPSFIAYGVYIGEVIVPVMIIIGFMTRPAALIYAINIMAATLLVKSSDFFSLSNVGAWGLESEALYFMGGVIIMLLGSGRYVLIRNKYFN